MFDMIYHVLIFLSTFWSVLACRRGKVFSCIENTLATTTKETMHTFLKKETREEDAAKQAKFCSAAPPPPISRSNKRYTSPL